MAVGDGFRVGEGATVSVGSWAVALGKEGVVAVGDVQAVTSQAANKSNAGVRSFIDGL